MLPPLTIRVGRGLRRKTPFTAVVASSNKCLEGAAGFGYAIVRRDGLPFAPCRFTCEPAVQLAERLLALALAPPAFRDGKVLFVPGGSEAIEVALKLARVTTGRFKMLSFWDAFHGAGFGASSVGGEALFRAGGIGPLLPGAEHVPPFACFRCTFGSLQPSGRPDLDRCRLACARTLTYTLGREGDVAAVLARPGLDAAGDLALGHDTHENNPLRRGPVADGADPR